MPESLSKTLIFLFCIMNTLHGYLIYIRHIILVDTWLETVYFENTYLS